MQLSNCQLLISVQTMWRHLSIVITQLSQLLNDTFDCFAGFCLDYFNCLINTSRAFILLSSLENSAAVKLAKSAAQMLI